MKAIQNLRALYPTLNKKSQRLIQATFALGALSVLCFLLTIAANSLGFQLGDGHGYLNNSGLASGLGIMWQIGYFGFAIGGTSALTLFIVTANKMKADREAA